MANYKGPLIGGASVFFTVNLAQRGGALLVDHIDVLREAVAVTKARRPFEIDAWVVLLDHMHGFGRCRMGTQIIRIVGVR